MSVAYQGLIILCDEITTAGILTVGLPLDCDNPASYADLKK